MVLYLYSSTAPLELEVQVELFRKEFETILGDLFSEIELTRFERLLDELATVDVQPILAEISFDDFYAPEEMRASFEKMQSVICLENMPFLENNPFQVSYLTRLIEEVGEVLIDRGGIEELQRSRDFIEEIKVLKSMESLIEVSSEPKLVAQVIKGPIDYLLDDVYREIDRLEGQVLVANMTERQQKIYLPLKQHRPDALNLLKLSGLNPKDFGDGLESLKFFLKRQV
ncbi:MAG: hypothetical protein ACLGG0_06945 [Bacteriovoracia bacterium]